jgi:transposase
VTTGFGAEFSGLESENRKPTAASTCEPFRAAIELGLSQGRNAMAIWQDLVADTGFSGSYQSVKRFIRKLRAAPSLQARAVIVTAPGEEAQVDYGSKGPMVRDPQTGKYRRTRLFVLTLGYSRKSVRLLTFRSSSRIWAELHEKAFRRLGGSTRVVVLDNLEEGVLIPDIYQPTLNPTFPDRSPYAASLRITTKSYSPHAPGLGRLKHLCRKCRSTASAASPWPSVCCPPSDSTDPPKPHS